MVNVKQIIKKYYPLLIILMILALSHLNTIINNDGLMIFYGDSYEQALHLYWGGWERMRALDFSLWDWSLGYGSNYFAHITYFATSPFFFLTLLFEKALIPYLFIYLNGLKILLLFIFSYRWLSRLYTDKLIPTVGAIVLSFSGWVVFFYHYNQFLDSFLFFPLILSAIEDYLSQKKWVLYTLTLACLGIISYYFLYMLIPFIFLYSVFRYFIINRLFNFKHFYQTVLMFLFYSILGIGISSFVLLPAINLILQIPRLETISSVSLFQTIDKIDIFRYFTTIFSPAVERFDPTYYIARSYDSGIGWGGGVSLYSFMLFPINFILLIKSDDKYHRNRIFVFYLVLLFMATFSIFYRILQGSYDVRWYYMFTFLNVYSICFVLNEHIKKPKPKSLIFIANLTVSLIIILLLYISTSKGIYTDLNILRLIVLLTIILSTIYSLILFFRLNKYTLLLIVSIEAIFSFLIPLYFDYPIEKETLTYHIENALDREAIDYIESIDNGFYRIISEGNEYTSQNEPMSQYYKGTSFYTSLYNFEQEDFLNRFKSNWSMPVTFGRYNTNFITSVKYYISINNKHEVPFGFEYLTSINDKIIYINKYYIPLGFSTSKTLNANTFSKLPYLDQDRLLLDYIITEESTNNTFEFRNKMTNIAEWVYDANYYFDNIQDLQNKIIYIENFDIPSFSINKNNNGQFVSTENFWQYNYVAIYFNDISPIDALEMKANNIYNSRTGYNIYLDEDLSYYDTWYSEIKETTFRNVEIHQANVKATIELKEDSWVATSIPYDKGWRVKANGKYIDFSKVNMGFIGFELNKGNYQLDFSYTPPLFYIGILISFISTMIFIVLTILNRKKILNKHLIVKSVD